MVLHPQVTTMTILHDTVWTWGCEKKVFFDICPKENKKFFSELDIFMHL